jgi:hypothetical protein
MVSFGNSPEDGILGAWRMGVSGVQRQRDHKSFFYPSRCPQSAIFVIIFSAPNNNSCVHITQLLNRFWLLRFIEYIKKMFTKRK